MSELYQKFTSIASGRKNEIAMSTGTEAISFEEMLSRSKVSAESLSKKSRPNDIALVALKNRLELASIIPALWNLGFSVALASPKYSLSETSAILDGLSPDMIITDAVESYRGSSRKYEFTKYTSDSDISVGYPTQTGVEHNPRAEWYPVIKLTSGSTGVPKAVALSESSLLAEAETIRTTLQITERDTILAPVPLVHSYGFDLGFLMMLLVGAKLSAREGFIPRAVAREMDTAEIFLGVPTMYQAFLDTRFTQPPQFTKPRFLISCTAPLSSAVIRSFHERFGAVICQHYGSSEAGATTFHSSHDVLASPNSVGKAMNGVRIRVADSDDGDLDVLTEGEIVVVSDAVARGYLMGAPTDGSPLDSGEYRTGDMGYRDADGHIFVTGRKDQLINVGGLKVSPQEVVAVLEACPEVQEAAVKGVADPTGMVIVCAFVVCNQTITESAVIDTCRTQLADYKVPRRVVFLERLPRTANGKVILSALDLPYIEK
jgi:acyl-CoA synthetase (AMP-forming)/AMP-acid ligase II